MLRFAKIIVAAKLSVSWYVKNAVIGKRIVFRILFKDRYCVCFFKIMSCSIIIDIGLNKIIKKVPTIINKIKSLAKVLFMITNNEIGNIKNTVLNENAVAVLKYSSSFDDSSLMLSTR